MTMPAWSLEAEQLILGGLFNNDTAWDACGHLVKAEDFFRADHRLIFSAIANLARAGKPYEVHVVAEAMKQADTLDRIDGGIEYIIDIYKNTASSASIAHYAGIVAERALGRRAMAAWAGAGEILKASDGTISDRVNAACSHMQDAVESDSEAEVPLLQAYGREWLAEQEELFRSGRKMVGLATGFTDLDETTLGMPPGELVVIAARPSMGKSAFALNICANAANAGKSVFIASMEMPKSAVMNRFASAEGRVNYKLVRSAKFDETGPGLTRYAEKLYSWKLAVDDRPRLDVNRLESLLRAHRRRHGLDLVMVDYLQLMDMGRDTNRNNAVSACTRDLKILAGLMGVPIILLSQLNRDLEKRADKRPQMSDLRDSGSIEQDAHTLLFLYRDVVYNPNTPYPEYTEIIVAKARDSERGLVLPLNTQLHQMRFGNVDWPSMPAIWRAQS